jgi:hypothetical protein
LGIKLAGSERFDKISFPRFKSLVVARPPPFRLGAFNFFSDLRDNGFFEAVRGFCERDCDDSGIETALAFAHGTQAKVPGIIKRGRKPPGFTVNCPLPSCGQHRLLYRRPHNTSRVELAQSTLSRTDNSHKKFLRVSWAGGGTVENGRCRC